MTYYSRREIEEFHPELNNIVYKVVGNEDSTIVNTLENCLYNGYDKQRISDKLSSALDEKKANRVIDKVHQFLDHYRNSQKGRKRSHETDNRDKESKKSRSRSDKPSEEKSKNDQKEKPSDDHDAKTNSSLSSHQIKQMMANAQREIEERKRALLALKVKDPDQASAPQVGVPVVANQTLATNKPEDERARKIAELQAQIRAKLSGSLSAIIPPVQERPKPLILDEEGRTIDKSGRTISIPTVAPTLKANIRAKKREVFNKSQISEKAYQEDVVKFFDDRIMAKPALRNKRSLRFHEPGKFQQMAERLRMKAQLEKLQNEISQIARKTGISSATKLALIAPKQDSHADDVPGMEWWDY